jgi:2-methylisocitrate lyase-like PEP mutase family enzyme
MTLLEKRQAFRQLHQEGCFVLPNPWDVGIARYLQHAGFAALATSSAALAFSRGKPDSYNRAQSALTLEETLSHVAEMVAACEVPIQADFENGFAADCQELALNVRRCADTGVAGLSIEDNAGGRLYPIDEAVARVRAAAQALAGSDVVLVARCEGLLLGQADLHETLQRLRAYAEAGADCLYAPDLDHPDQVSAVVRACYPKPVNVLVSSPRFSLAQLRDLGVRRISLGGALARAAWGGIMRAAHEILEHGTFEELARGARFDEIHGFFEADWPRHGPHSRGLDQPKN